MANQAQPTVTGRGHQKYRASDCALLLNQNPCQVIGGFTIGFAENHRTQFVVSTGSSGPTLPYVGLEITIPRGECRSASFYDSDDKLSRDIFLTIKLPFGTWDMTREAPSNAIHDKLRSAHYAKAVFVSLPDAPPYQQSAYHLRADPQKSGACLRVPKWVRFYHARVSVCRLLTLYDNSTWSMDRYRREHQDLQRADQYAFHTFRFDNYEDYAVATAQGVVQDVFDLALDVADIRNHMVRCAFLRKLGDGEVAFSHDDKAKEFRALVWLDLDVSVHLPAHYIVITNHGFRWKGTDNRWVA